MGRCAMVDRGLCGRLSRLLPVGGGSPRARGGVHKVSWETQADIPFFREEVAGELAV